MEKIEIILTECIREIKSGKATLAECLDHYPARRQDLEPLLRTALNIQEPPEIKLDSGYKQAAKARLLQQIRTSRQEKARSFKDRFTFGIPPQYAWARVAVSVIIGVILVSSAGSGTALAAQSSLPGDLLYPVKTGTEDVRLLVASGSVAKAELNLEFAENRLEELSELVNIEEGKAGIAVAGYQGNLGAVVEQVLKVSDNSALSGLLESALADIRNQTAFCDKILDAGPEYSGSAVNAGNLAVAEQLRLTGILEEQDNLRAARINLDMMQNRLQRARDKAGSNQYRLLQEALLQYQQFNRLGEQILQRAQASENQNVAIEALTLQALDGSLETLDDIYQQAPPEYRNTIEACRQMTIQFRNQAHHQHQQQGNSDSSPESPASGNGKGPGQESQPTPQSPGTTETGSWPTVTTNPPDAGETPSDSEAPGADAPTKPGEENGTGLTTTKPGPGPGTPQSPDSTPKNS